jgi:hypothetical protein
MREPAGARPSAAWIVAAAALVLALASTAIAADPVAKLTKAKVRNIANKEIDRRAPGLSVDSASIAAFANDADTLDGVDSTGFVRAGGCARGKVLGFARFNGASISASPTYSTAGIQVPENCSGGTVEATRIAAGQYRIRFNGLDAVIAVCTSMQDGTSFPLHYVALGLIGPGHWQAEVVDSFNDNYAEGKFGCVVV